MTTQEIASCDVLKDLWNSLRLYGQAIVSSLAGMLKAATDGKPADGQEPDSGATTDCRPPDRLA